MDALKWHPDCSLVSAGAAVGRPREERSMTQRESERDGGSGTGTPRLLFIVAHGQTELRVAIEHVLWGLPGLEVIENRRENRSLLPRCEQGSRADTTRC